MESHYLKFKSWINVEHENGMVLLRMQFKHQVNHSVIQSEGVMFRKGSDDASHFKKGKNS